MGDRPVYRSPSGGKVMLPAAHYCFYLDVGGIKDLLGRLSQRRGHYPQGTHDITTPAQRLADRALKGMILEPGDRDLLVRLMERKDAESALPHILKALGDTLPLLVVDRVKALAHLPSDRLPAYVTGRLPFTIVGLYSRDTVYHEVVQTQTLALRVDQTSLCEDYSIWPRILMGGSVTNLIEAPRPGAVLAHHSPLAMLLQRLWREPVQFRFFGRAYGGHNVLYVKPLAIWQNHEQPMENKTKGRDSSRNAESEIELETN